MVWTEDEQKRESLACDGWTRCVEMASDFFSAREKQSVFVAVQGTVAIYGSWQRRPCHGSTTGLEKLRPLC